ncbi:MAG: TonB-dependent receptor [Calditrichaeota bacterium]|nr:TonB-dependent receptor [Calditrichota bacterium]
MRKHYVYGILALLFALLGMPGGAISGSTGKIVGHVIDAKSRTPLPGVNVMLVGTRMGAATDANGYYFIINVPPGNYTVKASMIGYQAVEKTGVLVEIDRTVRVNFRLNPAVISGKPVVVTAKREIVPMDVSASQITIQGEKTQLMPVNTIQDAIRLTPGVYIDDQTNFITVRGGGGDQVLVLVDGVSMTDNLFNRPFLSINRSAIEQVSIQTGGFNAEYGNLRSGLFNIVTKEGGNRYNLSLDYKYRFPSLKYEGPKLFTPAHKDYLMYGSDVSMDSSRLRQMFPNPEDYFMGWVAFSENKMTDSDSSNDLSPVQRRDLWLWRHRGFPHGDKPDHYLDGTLTGPVPGRSLPIWGAFARRSTFLLSHRFNKVMYAQPAVRNHFFDRNSIIKLTTHITPSMKLTLSGMFAKEWGMAKADPHYPNGLFIYHTGMGKRYGGCENPVGDLTTNMFDINFTHTLSPRTFYEVRLSRMQTQYHITHGPDRDTTKIKFIPADWYTVQGDTLHVPGYWDSKSGHYVVHDTTFYKGDSVWFPASSYDETPHGWIIGGQTFNDQPGKVNLDNTSIDFDSSKGWTTIFKFDLTSQVNQYHQIKTGLYMDMSRLDRRYRELTFQRKKRLSFSSPPRKAAVYVQDRIEVKGMIANIGFRAEYFDAHGKVYEPGNPFSRAFGPGFWDRIDGDSLKYTLSKKHFFISPRLGISHPMTANSKIYFNYGHFYSPPLTFHLYGFYNRSDYESQAEFIGNPNLKPPRTIAYELGFDMDVRQMFLIHTDIFYKDVTNEEGAIYYTSIDKITNYKTWTNKKYEDIIGWELRINKRVGRFFTGWIQTQFMGQRSGEVGYQHLYEPDDPLNVPTYSRFSVPISRLWRWKPSFQGYVDLHSPENWGPRLLNHRIFSGFHINTIIHWAAGDKFTWNPDNKPFIRDNLQWKNYFRSDIYMSKNFKVGSVTVSPYLDMRNLFARKMLNVGILRGLAANPGSEIYKYYASLRKGDRVGDYKQSYLKYPHSKPGEPLYIHQGGPKEVYMGIHIELR